MGSGSTHNSMRSRKCWILALWLASKLEEAEREAVIGDLTESGVKDLFAKLRRRETGPTPQGAKGWAKFWITDGVLSKYQFKIQGKLTSASGEREAEINRTTTVEIKDIGSTTVKVPDDAKKKLT